MLRIREKLTDSSRQIPVKPNDTLSEELHLRKVNKCLPPRVVSSPTPVDEVRSSIFKIIDEFVFRAIVLKPQLFSYTSNTSPRVYPAALRGFWFGCFQYYMWKIGCCEGDYPLPTGYGTCSIPLGLAKVFQYFAPYVDPATGSEFRHSITVTDPNIYTDYASVDMRGILGYRVVPWEKPWFELNSPLDRFLISAANMGGQMIDYGAAEGMQATVDGPFNSVLWSEYFSAPDSTGKFRAMQSVFDSNITVNEIPSNSPDGSAHCLVLDNVIASPVPNYSKSMAFMLSPLTTDNQYAPDQDINYLYDSGIPVVRVPSRSGQQEPSDVKAKTLRSVYAYMTSFSQKWVPDQAKFLMLDAGDLSGATSFSYRHSEVSSYRFARVVMSAIVTDIWSGSGLEVTNKIFSLVQLAWSAYFQRLFPLACIPHATPENYGYLSQTLPVVSCYYHSSSIVTTARFPIIIAQALSKIGIIRVGTKLIFPTDWQLGRMNTTTRYDATADGSTGGWTDAVAPSGIWVPYLSPYGTTMVGISTIFLTYPRTSNAIIYNGALLVSTYNAAVQYGINMSLLQSLLGQAYLNSYPETLGSDRWTPLPKTVLGGIPEMLVRTYATLTTPPNPTWQNQYLKQTNVLTYEAVSASLCMPAQECLSSALFGLTPVRTDFNSDTDERPLYIEYRTSYSDPSISVQASVNSSPNSQYQANVQAAAVSTAKDDFAAASSVVEQRVSESSSTILSALTPAYDGIQNVATALAAQAGSYAGSQARRIVNQWLMPIVIGVASQAFTGAVQYGRQLFTGRRNGNNRQRGVRLLQQGHDVFEL